MRTSTICVRACALLIITAVGATQRPVRDATANGDDRLELGEDATATVVPSEGPGGVVDLTFSPRPVPDYAADEAVDGAILADSASSGNLTIKQEQLESAIKRLKKNMKQTTFMWKARAGQEVQLGKNITKTGKVSDEKFAEPNPASYSDPSSTKDPYPAGYPPQCRLYNFEKEYLPTLGCSCDAAGCRERQLSGSSVPNNVGCTAPRGEPCFGKEDVMCHPSAATQKVESRVCHHTCATCSPGQDKLGKASPEACRSCPPHAAWMPQGNPPECAVGQVQGSCVLFPSPARRCKTSCTPDTLTTDHRPKILRVVNDSETNKTTYTEEKNIPVLACSKACTDGYAINLRTVRETKESHRTTKAAAHGSSRIVDGEKAFGSTLTEGNSTTVFCATYKLVSCKWEPSSQSESPEAPQKDEEGNRKPGTWETWWGPSPDNWLGGKYVCNQRKHAVFVGFQLQADEDSFSAYDPEKTFYAVDDPLVRKIVAGWKQDAAFHTRFAEINRTVFPEVPEHLLFGPPKGDVQMANLYDFLVAHGPLSLCAKHALLA